MTYPIRRSCLIAAFPLTLAGLVAAATVRAADPLARAVPDPRTDPRAAAAPAQPTAAHTAPESINLRRTVTVEVVERTKDAVVYISTTKLVTRRAAGPFGDPFLMPFDSGEIVRVPANSLGSGFIVHPDGYVVTNNHVIDRARQITVELIDGRKLPAELVSADADADLAVLRIRSDKPLPTLELGDSSDLMIGEPVIAVGNPLGFSHTVSTGIVSALHRDLKDPRGKTMLGDLVQTDAAINPGNSGGPLLNAYGQVIGINTAIRGDAQNIGFSIGFNRLRDLIPELMNPANVTKVDVGLRLAERRIVAPPARVTSEICLADAKGNASGRVVSAIDGRRPRDIIDAYAMLLRTRENGRISVQYAGEREPVVIACKPVPQPDAVVQARKLLGVSIEPVTPMLAEKYRLPTEDGLFVSEVLKDSIAAKAGVQAGDVIFQLGRYRVSNLNDFGALLHRLPETGSVRIGIMRGEQVGYGELEL
jgi:serine protease Do